MSRFPETSASARVAFAGMDWITLRRFVWKERTNAVGTPEVIDITQLAGPRRLPIDFSDVIYTNALATPVLHSVRYKAAQHELRLLGSYLRHGLGRTIGVRHEALWSSSRHIRSFVTESAGLGMLTATVQAAFRWKARGETFNIDALPTGLAGSYAKRGSRPDLLFDLPIGRLAGEARGRSWRPPNAPRKEHYNRLNSLLPWSAYHNHPLVMTWTYVTDAGISVDLFTPVSGIPGLEDPLGDELPYQMSDAPVETAVRWVDLHDLSDMKDQTNSDRTARGAFGKVDEDEEGVEESQDDSRGRFDRMTPGEIASVARYRVRELENQLFATAPQTTSLRVADRALHGEWIPFDLVGQTTGSLLFAVLEEPLSPTDAAEIEAALRHRISNRQDQEDAIGNEVGDLQRTDTSLTLRGRVLVIVTRKGDQSWELIAD